MRRNSGHALHLVDSRASASNRHTRPRRHPQATGIAAETIAAFASGKAPLPPGGVVIVDEAGMVGTEAARNLMAQAEARGCRVIAVGDPRQLAAVKEAGGWLEMVISTSSAIRGKVR